MNKRGQFYLVIALAIIFVLFSFRTIYTSLDRSEKLISVESLSEEIYDEGRMIVDNGIFNNDKMNEIAQNLEEMIA